MTNTPVVSVDLARIQDIYLTRASVLLARGADEREWQFVVDAARTAAADEWDSRDAFLFDFTLGRLLVALRGDSPSPEAGTFVDYFSMAIRAGASRSARNIWAAERATHDEHPDALTVMLLAALTVNLPQTAHAGLLQALPGPYRP